MVFVQSNPNTPRKHSRNAGVDRRVLGATSPNKINVSSNTTTSPFHSIKLKPVPSPLKPKSIALHQPQTQLAPSPIRKGTQATPFATSPLKSTHATVKSTPVKPQSKQDTLHTCSPEDQPGALDLQQQKANLLNQYSIKQAQIKRHQQILSHKQLQLLEIESQLQELNKIQLLQSTPKNNTHLDIYKQASLETERQLTNAQLTIVDLNKTPSPLKNPTPLKHTLLKQTSFITSAIDECCTTMGKKATVMFNNSSNNSNNDDNERNIFAKPQFKSDRFESLTKQTSQFFNDLLQIKDKKMVGFNDDDEQNHHDSFDIDSLGIDVVYEQVDIDDYDSSFD
ncbi:hypothetical protein FOB58_001084 [Candida parapsilosis]|uniref:Uncharacterized protein n=2 Tax=Candida parapsilosis TaxID=5480 RepID=G8BFQ4_CANPC|nr:uncharacterized protein CPAR2_203310 [Candida parapsilosis]KAF6055162.1 hypothetical protein FOB58_001084 [Candida parapsilosis]KAF6055815.1 hypothetical protein FOB59_000327 [Candida parapsilosis]KAF6058745.1 hypothetical protein FOB60_000327 [Candida parapsilosis]KAF6067502.1 hypothetical protein FOB61_000327 [Candida parapsilosis]KAI5901408.1 hypothetical protein K4G60_g545 [Candida parapsilosis]